MIFLVLFLSLVAAQTMSCNTLGVKIRKNVSEEFNRESYRLDDTSLGDRDKKLSSLRSKRDLESSTAYEREINRTISDYYAQRKAVMDRYYARQREIVEKFGTGRTFTTDRPVFLETPTAEIQSTTDEINDEDRDETEENNKYLRAASDENETDRDGKNNSPNSWIYGSNNWNSNLLGKESDIDLQSETSNTLERSVDRIDDGPKAGYYKLGSFRGSKDEKVVYQHNLGVGVKGPSQLDATFESVIEGPYEITIVEAFPYANTRANFTWLAGGPGTGFVKLKLQGFENEGFSYSVKIWGIPKKDSE